MNEQEAVIQPPNNLSATEVSQSVKTEAKELLVVPPGPASRAARRDHPSRTLAGHSHCETALEGWPEGGNDP